MAIEMIEEFSMGTQIKVIGVGGGGGNAVEHMIVQGVQGVQFVCANTDAQALNRSAAHDLIQLGTTGLGAGAKPECGRAAAEEAVDRIRQAIDGSHMLFHKQIDRCFARRQCHLRRSRQVHSPSIGSWWYHRWLRLSLHWRRAYLQVAMSAPQRTARKPPP